MKRLILQFLRFCAVGISAFAIDYALLALFTEVFGINYLISAAMSYIISIVYNYLASMRFVYVHKEEMGRAREFILFVVLSVIGLGLNNLLLWAFVEQVNIHYLVAKIIVGAIVSIWNFGSRKYFLDAGVDQNMRRENNDKRSE